MCELRKAKRYKEYIENISSFTTGRVQPILKLNCSMKPYFAGTGFCLKVNNRPYLITARHVLERDELNSCDSEDEIFCFSEGQLRQIDRFEKLHLRLITAHGGVPLDLVAITPINLPIESIFQGGFTESDIFTEELKPQHYLSAIGYPITKNKRKHNSFELTNRPYGYFGRCITSTKILEIDFDPSIYFGLEINIKKAYSHAGKKVRVAKPHGISGGPVFNVYDFDNPNTFADPKLVGIITEMPKNKQCLVGVNIGCLISAISVGV